MFLVCHCPSHFLSVKLFFETGQLIIWGLWKSWSDYFRVWENCLTLGPPRSKSQGVPPGAAWLSCSLKVLGAICKRYDNYNNFAKLSMCQAVIKSRCWGSYRRSKIAIACENFRLKFISKSIERYSQEGLNPKTYGPDSLGSETWIDSGYLGVLE